MDDGLSRNAVDVCWCPLCSERASASALLIHVLGVKDMVGLWAIKYNKVFLKERDNEFEDSEDYYRNLFESGRCALARLAGKAKEPRYLIHGLKNRFSKEDMYRFLSGPDYSMIRDDGRPHKFPKDVRSGPRESYRPFKGYKS